MTSDELERRFDRLERLVCMLACGLLQHEYTKDLVRGGTEEACRKLANEYDLEGALKVLEDQR